MEDRQRGILVGANINNDEDFLNSMRELENLAISCDIEVIGVATQNLNRVNPSYYIGKGKLEEVLMAIEELDANIVIFNDELSPSQIKIIEENLQCKVIDRTVLILDIFAKRAKTKEAKHQVEVAYLEYMLPRLVGMGKSLERQRGGVGTRNRGSGEKKIELDRRRIEERIVQLNRELEDLVIKRETQVKKRRESEVTIVSLVGYTNSGKSTVMNTMIKTFSKASNKQVFEKNMLFATLETSVRHIKLDDNKTFLLTDTVGFVSKIPHNLIKAFRSTLEEVVEADLLVHVIDYSNPNYKKQIEVTNKTLEEIGVKDIPILYVYNKIDLTDNPIPRVYGDNVYISAKEGTGINELIDLIKDKVLKDYIKCEMLIPYNQGSLISYFNDNAHVLSRDYVDNGAKLTMECKISDCKRYEEYMIIS